MTDRMEALYRVVSEDGTIMLPCVSKPQAAAYVRTYNGLTRPDESPVHLQPLEDELMKMLWKAA